MIALMMTSELSRGRLYTMGAGQDDRGVGEDAAASGRSSVAETLCGRHCKGLLVDGSGKRSGLRFWTGGHHE